MLTAVSRQRVQGDVDHKQYKGRPVRLVASWTREVMEGGLLDFEEYMRLEYPDWEEFVAWMDARYQKVEGFRGGLPREWAQL
jgi:hypothetical protein